MAIFSIRNAKDLGIAIRSRRKTLGLDQMTLAKQAGVSRQWIVQIEKGKPRAAVGLVLKTLHILDIRFTTSDQASQKSELSIPTVDIDDILNRAPKGEK